MTIKRPFKWHWTFLQTKKFLLGLTWRDNALLVLFEPSQASFSKRLNGEGEIMLRPEIRWCTKTAFRFILIRKILCSMFEFRGTFMSSICRISTQKRLPFSNSEGHHTFPAWHVPTFWLLGFLIQIGTLAYRLLNGQRTTWSPCGCGLGPQKIQRSIWLRVEKFADEQHMRSNQVNVGARMRVVPQIRLWIKVLGLGMY